MKLGRWVECKYCYKNVKPELGGIYQLICSECGAGLTPDFHTPKALERYLKDESLTKEEQKLEDEAMKASCEAFKAGFCEPSSIEKGLVSIDTHAPQYRIRKFLEDKKNPSHR
jgi:hypothetical protein